MNIRDFAARLPKAELHNHMHGTLTSATLHKVAAANGVAVPDGFMDLPERYDDLRSFLEKLALIVRCIQSADDFHLVTYEMLKACAASGGRYLEFFVSPHAHIRHGASYPAMLDGMTQGMADAEKDHGIVSRIIANHNRELGPAQALDFIDLIRAHRRDAVIGIGLDFNEAPHPPGVFAALYEAARNAGLKTTAHAGEDGPAAYVRSALDDLKCMRIDHGYHIVEDADLVRRCRQSEMLFTTCPSTSLSTTQWRDLSAPDHAIRRMKDAGLTICINTDDAALFDTDLANEYAILGERAGFSPDDLATCALNSLRHSWLDETTKRTWLADWSQSIEGLRSEIRATAKPSS